MTLKRRYCPDCHFVQSDCLCAHISPMNSCHQLVILQHPSEVKHAKGSARLVKLALSESQMVVGETSADFDPLRQQLSQQSLPIYLIYPTDNSQAIEQIVYPLPPSILIFIDGSWKKTYKILQLNPWLAALPALHFSQAPETTYRIRKAPRADSLATIEAVAYCLEQLEHGHTAGLYTLFQAMIDNQWSHMPDDVKQRY